MEAPNNIQTLHVWDTEYTADSVEWCPIAPYQNVFVCGTYQLAQKRNEESAQDVSASPDETVTSQPCRRLGRLYLFAVDREEGLCSLQTLEMPAILDTKWCHCKLNGRVLLAVVNTVGEALIYEMRGDEMGGEGCKLWHSCRLSLLCQTSVAQDIDIDTLALSLDWSTGRCQFEDVGNSPCIVVSDSKGKVSLLQLSDLLLEKKESWKCHDFEAWITAFDYWNPSVIYTGGDDCRFNMYDLRTGTQYPSLSNKAHEAGVTSLHSNALFENVLASGRYGKLSCAMNGLLIMLYRYDENLRIWDTRHMRHPVHTTSLGGGVWRLKWDPHKWQHILAACMHGGFCVVDNSDITRPPVIVASYQEHQSLAYGSDWSHLVSDDVMICVQDETFVSEETRILATCSFYDHKLCVSAMKKLSAK